MIESADGPLVIDEIQRAPELLLPIKAAIDRDRRPGRFILAGSAQVMLLPKVSESFAGRVAVHTLWPFSQAEIESVAGRIIELLLDGSSRPGLAPASTREDLIERIVRGGFPEAGERPLELRGADADEPVVRGVLDLLPAQRPNRHADRYRAVRPSWRAESTSSLNLAC